MHAGTVNSWDAELYDGKMRFVSKFGEGILSLLNPQKGEKIIDLGCGTGDFIFAFNVESGLLIIKNRRFWI